MYVLDLYHNIQTLGFQRLTFALGNMKTPWPYIPLIATHVIELHMWYALSLSIVYPNNGRNNYDLMNVLTLVKNGDIKLGKTHRVLFLALPLLIVFFIYGFFKALLRGDKQSSKAKVT